MYERNAIVLERYFGKKLGYNESNNSKSNFNNYCDLLDRISNLGKKVEVERNATSEFNSISEEVDSIRSQQEKLYKREAKLEYNRNILFSNIEEKPEELNRVFEKLEEDIKKIQDSLLELRIAYVEAIAQYQVKKAALIDAHKEKQQAEKEYADSYRQTKETYDNIDNGFIIYIKGINTEELRKIKKELIDVITKNGEKEKVPFDPDVVSKAAEFATDIAKKEADILTYVFEKTGKLLEEIENKSFKPARHSKWRKDATAELDFFNSEREYLIAFLDNERVPVMSGKKTHRKLMLEACRNLVQDVEQMNNLYELLLREEAGRSAKKAYKDLYNKDYLSQIEASEKEVEVQATKLNVSSATLLNSNYWRIEGMRSVYQSFYTSVTEFYGKDLEEFEPQPEEVQVEEIQEVQEEDDGFELPKAKNIQDVPEEQEVEEEEVQEEVEPQKELSSAERVVNELDKLDEEQNGAKPDVPEISFDIDDTEDDIKEYDIDRIFEKVERMKFSDDSKTNKIAVVQEDEVEDIKEAKVETKKAAKEAKVKTIEEIKEDIAEIEDTKVAEVEVAKVEETVKPKKIEIKPEKTKAITVVEKEEDDIVDEPTIKIEKIPETIEPIISFDDGYSSIENQIDELEDKKDSDIDLGDDMPYEEETADSEEDLYGNDYSSLTTDSLFEQYAKARETQETLNEAFTKLKNNKKTEKKKNGLFGSIMKMNGKKAKGEM